MVEPLTARAANFCAPAHEVKFTCLDLKAVEVDGSFEGYASLFHREDMSRDVVLPGAFSESLARRGPAGVKMLFQHDANQPIGVWATLREDARGLYAQGRLMPEVAKAREVHALMRAGALGPVIGIDITGELVREASEHLVETVQAVGGLIGTAMTIYGRVRATAPLDRRNVTMKV